MKKHSFLAGMLTMALIISLGFSALAATGSFTITVDPVNIQVNGTTFAPKDAKGNDVPVFAYNGTTYAPLRALAEAYGLQVGYDSSTNMATVGKTAQPAPDGTQPILVDMWGKDITDYEINTVSVTVNGNAVSSDGTLTIVCSNKTYVNSEILEEVMGLDLKPADFHSRDMIFLNGVTFTTIRDFSEITASEVSFDSASSTVAFIKENKSGDSSPAFVCEIGKQYSTDSGYGVTINSASTSTVKGVPTFTFKYTLKNLTKDKYLNEDTFTIGFTDGASTNQGGIYMDGMYPNETLTKTYSLILDGKTVSYVLFNDGDSFFLTKPKQSDLDSHLVWYIK